MPVGAVVEPLLLVVDEPHVARVAGRRRHADESLSLVFFSLASVCLGWVGTWHGRATSLQLRMGALLF
jgi:hypothetical protein